jgi:transcriptional regulator with XRE-family HTH domain
MTLADRLKQARKKSGKTQEEMAKLSGVSYRVWQAYEAGKVTPGGKIFETLSDLGFNADWLLTGEGLMRKADREMFNIPLLTVIIEALEEYEVDVGKKLTPEEKADFISTACDMFIDAEAVSSQTKDKILESMKAVYDFLNSLDSMIKTKKGRERARKLLTKKFKMTFSKDDAEWEVEEFIGSRILKAHHEKGTLKFPVKDEDGTIRMVDFKDREAEKEAKNQKP